MDKMTEVLAKLISSTQDGKVHWVSTADPEVFITTVETIGVVVSHLDAGLLSMASDEQYRVQVLDPEGRAVESIETRIFSGLPNLGGLLTPEQIAPLRVADEDQKHAIRLLFLLARRSALDVDATLDELRNSLDALQPN